MSECTKKSSESSRTFPGYSRHNICFTDLLDLYSVLRAAINSYIVNGLYCLYELLGRIEGDMVNFFPSFKHALKIVVDVLDQEHQIKAITAERNRAHRLAWENILQLCDKHFLLKIKQMSSEFAKKI